MRLDVEMRREKLFAAKTVRNSSTCCPNMFLQIHFCTAELENFEPIAAVRFRAERRKPPLSISAILTHDHDQCKC